MSDRWTWKKRKKLGFSTGKRNLDDTSYTPGYKTGRGINAYDSCSYGCFVAITKVTKYDAKAILSDEKDISFADNKIEQCKIKWPNDIVLDKKKICGILTEMSAEPEHVNYVVTGIGINVNTTEFADEIKDMASSIFVQTGVRIKRSHVVAQFAHDLRNILIDL